ncbi:MAG TPA: hypothetical protein VFG07_03655 [Thermoplasmata archaeon]|nr:hypothetical protein [Thermoplasmata archaeon]
MSLQDLVLPLALSGGGASALTFAAWKLFNRYYVVVPPNRALVLYGRGSFGPKAGTAGDAVQFRQPRILVGGGVYVPPWRTGSGYLSLEPIDVDVRIRVSSALGDPTLSGWDAHVALQVKIPAEPGMLRTAAENLLGKSEEEIRQLVARTVEGAAPPLLVRLPPDDGAVDWERLATEIQASTARDLVANGLVIRSLSVKELRRINGPAEVLGGREPAALPVPELLWTPENPRVRLPALESRLGASGSAIQIGATEREGANGDPQPSGAPDGASDSNPTGTRFPSSSRHLPASRGSLGRSGARRPPLNVKQ